MLKWKQKQKQGNDKIDLGKERFRIVMKACWHVNEGFIVKRGESIQGRGGTGARGWRWDRVECVCELGRGCFDRSLVPSAVREMRRSGHVGCCSVSHNLEFGFTLRTVGNHGKGLSKGVKWLDLQWLKQNKTKHSVYCGKNGLAGSQNGRRENKLEALPSPQRLYGVMVIVVCDLFLFLVPP